MLNLLTLNNTASAFELKVLFSITQRVKKYIKNPVNSLCFVKDFEYTSS